MDCISEFGVLLIFAVQMRIFRPTGTHTRLHMNQIGAICARRICGHHNANYIYNDLCTQTHSHANSSLDGIWSSAGPVSMSRVVSVRVTLHLHDTTIHVNNHQMCIQTSRAQTSRDSPPVFRVQRSHEIVCNEYAHSLLNTF